MDIGNAARRWAFGRQGRGKVDGALRHLRAGLISAVFVLGGGSGLIAEERMFETFEENPAQRWDFVADTVMGGVSSGNVAFVQEDGVAFARMTGSVSTENNGGFIQFRHKMDAPPPEGVTGVRLVVRGNREGYFVHLRTRGTVLPWHYYQAGFDTTEGWREIRLPLSAFEASAQGLRATPVAGSLTSIGVVAYGRDHAARVDVREIDFY